MSDPLRQERVARAALCRLAEPGDPRLAGLVAELGAVRVHAHLAAERDLAGVLSDVAARLISLDPKADLEQAAAKGLRFVIPGDPEWPRSLDDLEHAPVIQGRGGPPLGLWVRGPLNLAELRSPVSIVGSRSATTYGVQAAADIAADIASAGAAVISGAAFGIDHAAHRGPWVRADARWRCWPVVLIGATPRHTRA